MKGCPHYPRDKKQQINHLGLHLEKEFIHKHGVGVVNDTLDCTIHILSTGKRRSDKKVTDYSSRMFKTG